MKVSTQKRQLLQWNSALRGCFKEQLKLGAWTPYENIQNFQLPPLMGDNMCDWSPKFPEAYWTSTTGLKTILTISKLTKGHVSLYRQTNNTKCLYFHYITFLFKSNLYDVIVWIIQRAYCFMKIYMMHTYYYVLNCYIETNTFLW